MELGLTQLTEATIEIQKLLARMDERQIHMEQRITDILEQTTHINRRVTAIEKVDLDKILRDLQRLEKEITDIKEVNVKQDTALKTKKSMGAVILDVVRWGALAYLVLKGGADITDLINK